MLEEIRLLESNELPGSGTYNQVARALRYMRSTSDSLTFQIGPDGGIWITMMPDPANASGEAEAERPSLYAYLDNGLWRVTAGHIRYPGATIAVPQSSGTAYSGRYVWVAWTSSSASVDSGASLPSLYDTATGTICTPLARISGGSITRLHAGGDIVAYTVPAMFISGYSTTDEKARVIQSGQERYEEIGTCP